MYVALRKVKLKKGTLINHFPICIDGVMSKQRGHNLLMATLAMDTFNIMLTSREKSVSGSIISHKRIPEYNNRCCVPNDSDWDRTKPRLVFIHVEPVIGGSNLYNRKFGFQVADLLM